MTKKEEAEAFAREQDAYQKGLEDGYDSSQIDNDRKSFAMAALMGLVMQGEMSNVATKAVELADAVLFVLRKAPTKPGRDT